MIRHTTMDRGFLIIHISSSGESYGWFHIKAPLKYFFIHGWVLWIVWGVLAFWQMGVMRYFRHYYKPSLLFHVVNGCFILIVSLVFTVKGIA